MMETPRPDLEKRLPSPGDEGRAGADATSSRTSSGYRLLQILIAVCLVLLVVPTARVACSRRSSETAPAFSVIHGPAAFAGSHVLDELDAARDVDHRTPSSKREDASASAEAARPTVVECFQVTQPVLTPKGPTTSDGHVGPGTAAPATKSSCTVVLMDHIFGASYGKPFVGESPG